MSLANINFNVNYQSNNYHPDKGSVVSSDNSVDSSVDLPASKQVSSTAKTETQNEPKSSLNKQNQSLSDLSLDSGYSKDKKTGEMVWQLKDSQTGQVLKQIPPEYKLQLEQSIDGFLKLYDKSGSSNASVQTSNGNSSSGLLLNEKS